jgi:hypothetical protein
MSHIQYSLVYGSLHCDSQSYIHFSPYCSCFWFWPADLPKENEPVEPPGPNPKALGVAFAGLPNNGCVGRSPDADVDVCPNAELAGPPNVKPAAGFVCAPPAEVDADVAASVLFPNMNVDVGEDVPNVVLPMADGGLAASPEPPNTEVGLTAPAPPPNIDGGLEPSVSLDPEPAAPNEKAPVDAGPDAGDPAGVVENGLLVLLPNVGIDLDADASPPAVAGFPKIFVDDDEANVEPPKAADAPPNGEGLAVSFFKPVVAPKTGAVAADFLDSSAATGTEVEAPYVGAVEDGFADQVGAFAEVVDDCPNENLGAEGAVPAGVVEDVPENEKSGVAGFELSEGAGVSVLTTAGVEANTEVGAAEVGAIFEGPVPKIDSCGVGAVAADGVEADVAVLGLAKEKGAGLDVASVGGGWDWVVAPRVKDEVLAGVVVDGVVAEACFVKKFGIDGVEDAVRAVEAVVVADGAWGSFGKENEGTEGAEV